MKSTDTAVPAPGVVSSPKTCFQGEEHTMPHPHRHRTTPDTARRLVHRMAHRLFAKVVRQEGAATAEYAIVTLAAVAFAGLLVAILRSEEVRGLLMDLVQRALSFGG